MINKIKEFIKRQRCKHKDLEFIDNIYGDEIIRMGGNRSIWKCKGCGKVIFKKYLYD